MDDLVDLPTVRSRHRGESVVRGEPHWSVTATRNRFPVMNGVTTEYEQYVFPDASALIDEVVREYFLEELRSESLGVLCFVI